jgi:hypothetical protein
MTGISKDNNDPNTPQGDSSSVSQTMSDYKTKFSADPLPDDQDSSESELPSRDVATPASFPTGNDVLTDITPSPDETGEQSVSGDMPDPASDDDALENAHAVGLRLDEDEEHPKELDIASDIDKAEEYHRSH